MPTSAFRARAHWTIAALSLTWLGCNAPSFDPPEHPNHHIEEGGALHADGHERPFLCGDGSDPSNRVECPPGRPTDDHASCDSAGCHGGYRYKNTPADFTRELFGSDGPSCFSCHGKEWDE